MSVLSRVKPIFKGRVPGQLVIQFANHCNAACPQCGMNKHNRIPRHRLAGDEIRRILDAAAEKGVKVVSFTGGEPLLFLDDLVDYIQYAGQAGLEFIRTGTNGFLFANPEQPGFEDRVKETADKLAAGPLRNFWISIDSAVPEAHEKMRGLPGVIKGVGKALPIFHERGLFPSANLGLNRNLDGPDNDVLWGRAENDPGERLEGFRREFRSALRKFYRLVIDLGFTMVNTCYPMSLDDDDKSPGGLQAVYAAAAADRVVRFDPGEKVMLFQALLETIPEFRPRVRVFSPRSNLGALIRQYKNDPELSYPCRGGVDFFYIDSRDGNTYPCGYRGRENLGKFPDLDLSKISRSTGCRECDWECFRDPSELFGPLVQLFDRPGELIKKVIRDREYFRLWLEDIRYYRAAGFFDGRRPPDYRKLEKFSSAGVAADETPPGSAPEHRKG
ncbi:MAG: radical SAM protein [Pseudomonadota bacterium]